MHDGIHGSRRITDGGLSSPYNLTNLQNVRIGPSLQPKLEEILIAAYRLKGVSQVTTVPQHQQTVDTEVDNLIDVIKGVLKTLK